MMTTRATLTRLRTSTLAIMFSGRWEHRLTRDEQGRIFLDFNPVLFRHLLEQLRFIDDDDGSTIRLHAPASPSLVGPFDRLLRKLGIAQTAAASSSDVVELNVGGDMVTTRWQNIAHLSQPITHRFVDSDPVLFRASIRRASKSAPQPSPPVLEYDDDGICAKAQWDPKGITVAGGRDRGSGLDQLDHPMGVFVDKQSSIYIADTHNHRVMKWTAGARSGQIVADRQNSTDATNYVSSVVIDRNGSLYLCDRTQHRVERWSSDMKSHDILLSNQSCWGLALDKHASLYIAGHEDHRILQWPSRDIVAGGHGEGDNLNQLANPYQLYIDHERSIFIADYFNHRIMKWTRGAHEGTVVAGGHGYGEGAHQLKLPHSVVVDRMGTSYVVDFGNARIMRWLPNATSGVTIVGQGGPGKAPDQLSDPYDVAFDQQGNLYVADTSNHRIQIFKIDKSPCADRQ